MSSGRSWGVADTCVEWASDGGGLRAGEGLADFVVMDAPGNWAVAVASQIGACDALRIWNDFFVSEGRRIRRIVVAGA